MKQTSTRARVAIGSAAMVAAVCAVAGQLSAATESAPPSTTPDSEPVETVAASSPVELDPEREALVDGILSGSEMAGFPLDRDCVAGLVAQIPDEDVAIVAEDIATAADVAVATAVTVTEPTFSDEPADSAAAETEPVDTSTVESMTLETIPAYSEATEEIGRQMLGCAHGDADPALVADVLAVIEDDPEAPAFDMACVAGLLTTFSDETLTMMLEDEAALPTETAASVEVAVETVVPVTMTGSDSATEAPGTESSGTEETGLVEDPLASIPDDSFAEALSLLACAPGLLDELESDVAISSSPAIPTTETASAETVVGTETTTY